MTPDERLRRAQQELRDARAARRAAQQPAAPRNNNRRPAPAAAPAPETPADKWWRRTSSIFIAAILASATVVYAVKTNTPEDRDKWVAYENRKAEEAKTEAVKALAQSAPQTLHPPRPLDPTTQCDNAVVFTVKAGETRTLKQFEVWEAAVSNACKNTHSYYSRADFGTKFTARQCNSTSTRNYTSAEMSDVELVAAIKSGCVEIAVSRGRFYSYLQRK